MKPTILAIDDDPIILDMYQAILDEAYNLHLVSSGQEALNFLASHPRLDLILSDIMMPEMDGYQVCEKVRANPLWSCLKLILVSSKVTLEDRLRGYEAGADDYITKPFEGAELLAKIKVFLRLKDVEEIDRIKTNFITLLTHETRTPLTSILGFAALLRDSSSIGEKEKYFLDQIVRCAHVLSRLSEKTVLLSDLKSGKIRIEKGKIHLTDILAECQSKLTAAAQEKQLSFSSRIDPRLCIHGDPNLVAIAFDVLLDNAIKFAREGTVVDVAAEVKRPHIVVEVANDGEQIPAEHHEDIFDELSVRNVEHHHQGHGLSLAIARRIIESHDGVLSVTNRDNGPVFVIALYCPDL